MIETKTDYIPSFYKIENPYLDEDDIKEDNFWMNLIKATGIFFTISFIVFFVVNYSFIRSQLVDWKNQKKIATEYKAIIKKREEEVYKKDRENKTLK